MCAFVYLVIETDGVGVAVSDWGLGQAEGQGRGGVRRVRELFSLLSRVNSFSILNHCVLQVLFPLSPL